MQSAGQPASPDSVCESVKNCSEGKEPSRGCGEQRGGGRGGGVVVSERAGAKALGEEGESGYVKHQITR